MLLARDVHGLAGSLMLEQYTSQSRKHTMNAKHAVIARRARGKLFHQAAAEAVYKAVALGVEVVTCDVAADGRWSCGNPWASGNMAFFPTMHAVTVGLLTGIFCTCV